MEELKSVSYDQYSNIPSIDDLGKKSRIIFSEECYLRLLQMIKHTRGTDNETGCFFVGRSSKDDPYTILVDYSTTDFVCANGSVSGGAAKPTDSNYQELRSQISKYVNIGEGPIVFHFHTHPRKLHYEAFSDQDLSLYAKMGLDNPNTFSFGMLGFPVPNGNMTNGFSIVQAYRPIKNGEIGCAEFFMYPNIYYSIGNTIYKMGSFDKTYAGRKYQQNLGLGIVRNSRISSTPKKVCGVGVDPNTGQKISDDIAGYIDVDNNYCFTSDNKDFQFSSLSQEIEKGVHK